MRARSKTSGLKEKTKCGSEIIQPQQACRTLLRQDPRSENGFTKSFSSTGKDRHTFSASYDVRKAKDTTVVQILNGDSKDPFGDTQRPVLFIEAETYDKVLNKGKKNEKTEKYVRLVNHTNNGNVKKRIETRAAFYDGPAKFDLKLDFGPKDAKITVTSQKKNSKGKPIKTGRTDQKFDRYRDEDYFDKEITNKKFTGKSVTKTVKGKKKKFTPKDNSANFEATQLAGSAKHSVRYGNYHHDRDTVNGFTQTASSSEVRVTSAIIKKN